MSTEYISKAIREKVGTTAQHRCEYCQTAQEISGAQMNIEHIIPLSRGGSSEENNLCLSCIWCNSYKWAHTDGVDLESGERVLLFHPRTQQWHDHFRWNDNGDEIVGLTAVGRVTVTTLKMNNEFIVPARRHWADAGWHPPST